MTDTERALREALADACLRLNALEKAIQKARDVVWAGHHYNLVPPAVVAVADDLRIQITSARAALARAEGEPLPEHRSNAYGPCPRCGAPTERYGASDHRYRYVAPAPDARPDGAPLVSLLGDLLPLAESVPPIAARIRAVLAAYRASRSDRVTRFEVIDHRGAAQPFGRVFSAWDCRIELSYQDAGRTLKVFVDDGVGPDAK